MGKMVMACLACCSHEGGGDEGFGEEDKTGTAF